MPGDLLLAKCPCGYFKGVNPGHNRTIAYDPNEPDLIMVGYEEAQEKGLETIENPYLEYAAQTTLFDPDVQAAGHSQQFRCPKCGAQTLQFEFEALWD